MSKLDSAIELNGAIIRASEDWAKQYAKDPKNHAKLLKQEAKLQTGLRKFFKGVAKNSASYIDWGNFHAQVNAAFNVKVIVKDELIAALAQEFINVVLSNVTTMTALGAQSGESIYKIPLGIQSTDAIIQQLGKDHVASLVGMKVNKDGSIVPNPNSQLNILDSVRKDIAEAVKTSLALGENQEDTTGRIESIIGNPARSALIAQTESVNAYQAGLREFANQSGAVGKEWQDTGAEDVCADNTALGPIAIDESFQDSDGMDIDSPGAHPRCRCGMRLIYQEEWNNLDS